MNLLEKSPTIAVVKSDNTKIFNFASPEEIALHSQAIKTLRETNLETSYDLHFSIRSERDFLNVSKLITEVLANIDKLESIPMKDGKICNINKLKSTTYKFFKKKFNTTLNNLLQQLKDSSIFKNLLFIDDNFKLVSKRKTCAAKRQNLVGIKGMDFIRGSESDPSDGTSPEKLLILKLNIGRCGFETIEEMLHFLLSLIDKAGPSDLVIKKNINSAKSSHRINRRHTPTNTSNLENRLDNGGKIEIIEDHYYKTEFVIVLRYEGATILSSSDKIKNFLYGSSWNQSGIDKQRVNFDPELASAYVKSTPYHKFNKMVHRKILQLIDMNHSNPDFQYTLIRCCKLEPICNASSIIKKTTDKRSPFSCKCGMQLCKAGCGKVFHGTSDCSVSLDEATEQLLGEHKTCPGCNALVYKLEGCNHITCRCRVEFCYVCGNEYEKDDHDHYMVTEHHRDFCRQFDEIGINQFQNENVNIAAGNIAQRAVMDHWRYVD